MNPFGLNRRKRALCILPWVPDAKARADNTETPGKIHESFSRDLYGVPVVHSTILLGANNFQARVVQKVDSAIYPLVSLQPHGIMQLVFSIAYPLYGDLSCGQRYVTFEQPWPGGYTYPKRLRLFCVLPTAKGC